MGFARRGQRDLADVPVRGQVCDAAVAPFAQPATVVAVGDYGVGAQILHDLGLRKILLLSNHPPKVAALEGFELTVVGNVPLGHPASLKDQQGVADKPK